MDEKRDVSNLRRIREVNWAEIEAEETRLLRQMTPAEGIREYLALRNEFEAWLARDEAAEGAERIAHLVRLQERLGRLDEWKGDPVDKLIEALTRLQSLLEEAGIPSAAIGGLAVGAWGKARLTRDVDIKILLRRDERQRLLDLLAPKYRSLHADWDQALRHNGIAFILTPEGVRIDVMLTDIEFDEHVIARAKMIEIAPGRQARVCSPEDLIVLKIIAGRPQDEIDVASIIQKQGEQLDNAYILDWLRKFEQAIDDSTLVRRYQQARARYHRSR
ncbi:MAG TPA: nucleotidyltransferase [Anaerolineales bacterium]|nr:nucleotidyltransferase [Anaerolineales bacterium]